MTTGRISSLKQVAEVARHDGQLRHALRDFLDGFYAAPMPEKVHDEPARLAPSLNDDGFADAYLAAVCDHLCRQHRLPRPDWVRQSDRVLHTPYFAAKTHGLRMIYLQESPTAFKQRNIFVSANTLSRA